MIKEKITLTIEEQDLLDELAILQAQSEFEFGCPSIHRRVDQLTVTLEERGLIEVVEQQ